MSMVDSLSFALTQISSLVFSLNKKNYKFSIAEIGQIVNQHKPLAERHLLCCLFSAIDFSVTATDTKFNSKDYYHTQYLTQEIARIIAKPNFISLLCYAIDYPQHQQKTLRPSAQLLTQISKVLKLNQVQEVAFGLALLKSINLDTCSYAKNWIKIKLPDLLRSYVDSNNSGGQQSGGLHEISIEIVHLILGHLKEDKHNLNIPKELVEAFLKILKKDFPKHQVPVVLSPLLYPETEDLALTKAFRETSGISHLQDDNMVAERLEELGYNCAYTLEDMRSTLSELSAKELTPAAVARCICMFMRTSEGQIRHQIPFHPATTASSGQQPSPTTEDTGKVFTWAIDNFFTVVQELNPSLQFRQVIAELDCPQFRLTGRSSFMVLRQCIFRGLNDSLPIDLFYRPWKNVEGQLSLFRHFIMFHDVICLTQWDYRMTDLSKLKLSPDDERDPKLMFWRNIDFVEALLHLSDEGLYAEVREILNQPSETCPEMLLFTLLQSSTMNSLKKEMITCLLIHFLTPQHNSATVFAATWSSQQNNNLLRKVVLMVLIEYYNMSEAKGDFHCVPRIVEIGADLKMLSSLLQMPPHKMAIDLAVLAKKRDMHNLEKWLSDKIRDKDGESFVVALYDYIKERYPRGIGIIEEVKVTLPKDLILDSDTVKIIFKILMNPQLNNTTTAHQITQNVSRNLANLGPPPPSSSGASSGFPLPGSSLSSLPASLQQQSFGVAGLSRAPQPPIGTGGNKLTTANRLEYIKSFHPGSGTTTPHSVPPNTARSGFNQTMTNLQQFTNLNMSNHTFTVTGLPKFGTGNAGVALGMTAGNPWNSQQPMSQTSMPEPHRMPQQMMGLDHQGQLDIDASKEVDAEVTNVMNKLFNNTMTPSDIVKLIMDQMSSGQEGDPKSGGGKKFVTSIIRVIVDEFQRHLGDYPDKELKLMGELVGAVMATNMIMPKQMIRAMWQHLVNRFMKAGSSQEDIKFITALNCIITRHDKTDLAKYINLPVFLRRASAFNNLSPDAQETIIGAENIQKQNGGEQAGKLNLDLQSNQTQHSMGDPHVSTSSDTAYGSQQPGPMAEAKQLDPPSEMVMDRVFFLFNNVSKINVKEKVAELSEVVPDEYVPWLAQYIVVKRVTSEPNFHDLFVMLVDHLQEKMPGLRDKILQELFRNIKALLRNMKPDLQDFNDRTLLKNLGHFLGLITLGKNKPVLHDDINCKDLLYEAFHKGAIEMHYVVPFVARTMEGSADSIVFRPPNPWTMGLLKVLKELHGEKTVRLNLKFEVEILCKRLDFDFNALEPAYFLRDMSYLGKIETQLCSVVSNQERQSGMPVPMMSSQPASIKMPESIGGSLSGVSEASLIAHHEQQHQLQQSGSLNSQPSDSSLSSYVSGLTAHSAMQAVIHQNSSVSTIAPSNVSQASNLPSGNFAPQTPGRYRYSDINIMSLSSHLVIDDNLPILFSQPTIKSNVRPTIEKTVKDLIDPVYDRCLRIVLPTAEQLVRKDLALDPDENRMRMCAHATVRCLAAGLSLMTARDALGLSLITALRNMVLSSFRTANAALKDSVEAMANQIVNDNMEICLAFLQKNIAERCIIEIDNRLQADYEIRINARRENKRYYDMNVVQYHRLKMPERLAKQIGGPNQSEMAVYTEFQKNIPGFAPNGIDMSHRPKPTSMAAPILPPSTPVIFPPTHSMSVPSSSTSLQSQPDSSAAMGNIKGVYEKIIMDIERQLQCISNIIRTPSDPLVHSLRCLIDDAHLAKTNIEPSTAPQVVGKTVMSFMENYSIKSRDQPHGHEIVERLKEAHMAALRNIMSFEQAPNGYAWVTKHVTKTWINIEEPTPDHYTGKWNAEAFAELLKVHVINLSIFDQHMAREIKDGKVSALVFILDNFEQFIIGEKREFTVLNEYDMYSTIEAMNSVFHSPNNPYENNKELMRRLDNACVRIRRHLDLGLLATYQNHSTNYLYAGCSQAREFDDPASLQEQSELLMRNWLEIYMGPSQRDQKEFDEYVQRMKQKKVLQSEEMVTRFLRLATVFVVERSVTKLKQESNNATVARLGSYTELDAYARLVSLLVKRAEPNENIQLLNKALGIIAGTLLQEHEVRQDWFHPLPFQRILTMLFNELQSNEDSIMAPYQDKVLAAFCNVLHVLRPSRASAFVYSWLEIVSNRLFVAKMLPSSENKSFNHPMYAQLVVDLLKYLRFYLMNAIFNKPITFLYKGNLRCLLVLWHDFPDFLIEYHSLFCDVIPTNGIQLRNLILSATPKHMLNSTAMCEPLSAPQTPENLSQIDDPPGYCLEAGSRISPPSLKQQLDSYLATRTPVKFLSELVTRLKSDEVPNFNYNVELMNSLVLYLCITAIKTLRDTNYSLNIATIAHTAQMDIIQSLVLNMDNEGRYLLLNAMASQLRYPNSHTFYMSHTILYLFSEQSKDHVKEQITRVLLERLIVNRPHPWGLLVTLGELLRNPTYRFWDHEFVRCAPEIESVLESVARSCIPNFQMPPYTGSSSSSNQQPSSQPSITNGGVN